MKDNNVFKCGKCGEYVKKLYPIFINSDMIRMCWKCMQEYYKAQYKERMKTKKQVDL